MDDLNLEEIEARANAATDGPWWAWDRGVGWHIALGTPKDVDDWGHPSHLLPEGFRTDISRQADAEFIAHARTDIPKLIEEVRRLRTQLKKN